MVDSIGLALVALWSGAIAYAYVGYPVLLKMLVVLRGRYAISTEDPDEWPILSISLPAFNEEAVIGDTLRALLELEYPPDRLQIVVVSDASEDRTDEIVASFASEGVELVRLEARKGKTGAENAAVPHLRGEIVINTDATTRIVPSAVKPLVRAFTDPTVGVASGRDRSVGAGSTDALRGESSYVGYEMWIRDLETAVGTLVGASGCLYAVRKTLHRELVPEELSRDFIAALNARENGFRTVSVSGAVAEVERAGSLRAEYRRKVRTMARGLDSLFERRAMLNPVRYGWFAWMLASHKLCRWLVPLLLPGAVVGAALLASAGSGAALAGLAVAGLVGTGTAAALVWPDHSPMPRPLALAAYAGVGLAAGLVAWWKAVRRERKPVWEPTRRTGTVHERSTHR